MQPTVTLIDAEAKAIWKQLPKYGQGIFARRATRTHKSCLTGLLWVIVLSI